MDKGNSIVPGNLLIEGGLLTSFSGRQADLVIDARNCLVLPGFVQAHIHLCQTLFRGFAEDLSLIDWLQQRIWPLEAAHSAGSLRASARLGIAELIKGGTTCALTMETVHHTSEALKAVEETGFRATVGKCLIDRGSGVPTPLLEPLERAIDESLQLFETWHGRDNGRLRFCFAPRFALSCSRELLGKVAILSKERGLMVHTHAAENAAECEVVKAETGLTNIDYLHSLGLLGEQTALAHCVHLVDDEIQILTRTGTNVVHCPSSNLKLGSGLAPITRMLEEGIPVALGADGAACNNRLDMFTEMRTAALLQKVMYGPKALPAQRVLRMATIDGARVLGLDSQIGSLEIGKKADLIVVKLDEPHSIPLSGDLASELVYAAQPSDVRTVIIEGRVVMRDRKLSTIDETQVLADAQAEAHALLRRADLQPALQ